MISTREKAAFNHGVAVATIIAGRKAGKSEKEMYNESNITANTFWAMKGSEELVESALNKELEEYDAKKETA